MNDSSEQVLQQASVARRALSAKSEVFSSCHLWTPEFAQSAKRWLGNFPDSEAPIAASLLDGFLYFSERHATELMIAGFQALSGRLTAEAEAAAATSWSAFFDTLLVTSVEGESPNVTDSGPEAVRKFRKYAPFPQERAHTPYKALSLIVHGKADQVVFVDDFVGSGNQFIATWQRPRDYGGNDVFSFEDVFTQLPELRAYYCPSVCTTYGLQQIQAKCPAVVVSPGTLLTDRHDVLHPESLIWPPGRQAEGHAFIEAVSERLDLPDTNGARDDWRGFHKLGLAVAVRDTIPDATLRLFRLKKTGWAPLMEER